MTEPTKPAAAKPAPSKAVTKPPAAPRAPIPSKGKGVEIAGAVIGAALFVPALAIRGAKGVTTWVRGQWDK